MDNRTQNYIRNSFWGIASKLCTILLPFLVRSVLIYKMGIEYVGLNTLFSTVLQVLSLAELGIGSAFVVSMYAPIANNKLELVSALLNLYRKIYFIIGCIIGLTGLCITPFIKNMIGGGYPEELNIYVLYFLYLLNTVSSYFMFAYRASLLIVHQRNDIKNKINLILNIVQNCMQLAVLFWLADYYVYVLILPAITITTNIFIGFITKKMYPDIRPSGAVPKEMIRAIYKQVISLLWHKIGNTIIFSFDNIIISYFLGLSTLGIYNNYYYIFNSVASLFSIIYDSIIPGVGNGMVTEGTEENCRRFLKFNTLNMFLAGICSSCLMCLYQPFLEVWQGKSAMLELNTVVLMVILFAVWHSRRIIHTFKDAAGLWEIDRYRPICEALLNLILNIVLVQKIGINGIVLSTILSMLVVGIPWETFVFVKRFMNFSLLKYYTGLIRRFAEYIFGILIIYFICNKISGPAIGVFIFKAVVCAGLSLGIFVLFYAGNSEFKEIMRVFSRQFYKKRR